MKKILAIITTTLLLISYSVYLVSYADTESDIVEESTTGSEVQAPETGTPMAAGGEISSGAVGKGILLSPLLSESFRTDLATGSATVNIPIVVPPGRKNMQPNLALSYSNNNPNGICGVGWNLTTSSIQRSTKKGTPKYVVTDTFIFSSSGSTGELVLIDEINNEYRQKIETSFMKYVFDDTNSKWDVWDKNGTKYTFGSTVDSRILNPSDGTKMFAWFLDRVEDVYGNAVTFSYEKDESQVYLSRIEYTSNDIASPILQADKSVEFIYETGRPDILYNYRSGWKIQTNKRLSEIQVKVYEGDTWQLKWKYVLTYDQSVDTARSLLSEITLFDAEDNSLPPKQFTYQTVE